MTVVSDTSVLIHLARIDRFDLLRHLFSEITVPETVWHETVSEGKGQPGAPELQSARASGWIEVASVSTETGTWRLLHQALDKGEADVLALANQRGADLVLLDESAARNRAEALGLRKTGTIGLLLRAKREDLIDRVQPALDALRATSFWIDESLYRHALEAVGERSAET
jgi:predicted nucleic acid-binding protein